MFQPYSRHSKGSVELPPMVSRSITDKPIPVIDDLANLLIGDFSLTLLLD